MRRLVLTTGEHAALNADTGHLHAGCFAAVESSIRSDCLIQVSATLPLSHLPMFLSLQ